MSDGTVVRLGVDVGGVIISRANDHTDTSFFSDNYLNTTAEPHAFEALRDLNTILMGEVYIVSKCGPKVEAKTRAWMAHHDFHGRTGIQPAHLHFCRTRAEKAPIVKQLGITDFIDDKAEVLSYIRDGGGNQVKRLYLFKPDDAEVMRHGGPLTARTLNTPRCLRVESWDEVFDVFTYGFPIIAGARQGPRDPILPGRIS